jgi:hypothetical protein
MSFEKPITEIRGILLYTSPNKHTLSSIHSPYHSVGYLMYVDAFKRNCISPEESYIVGTRCGSEDFNQSRVDEYLEYRTYKKTMNEIILKNYPYVNLSDKKIFIKYEEMINKKWFGDNYLYIPSH